MRYRHKTRLKSMSYPQRHKDLFSLTDLYNIGLKNYMYSYSFKNGLKIFLTIIFLFAAISVGF